MSADAAPRVSTTRQELAATGANLAARIRGPSSLAAALATLRYHVTRGTLPPEVHLAAAIIVQELDATGVFADAARLQELARLLSLYAELAIADESQGVVIHDGCGVMARGNDLRAALDASLDAWGRAQAIKRGTQATSAAAAPDASRRDDA